MASSSSADTRVFLKSDWATLPRNYAGALQLLSLLPTNRDVTSLFEVTGVASDDLNARALPEFRAWLARAGYPDPVHDLAGLRCIHVAGTKGKGSVCAFATALLLASQPPGPQASSSQAISSDSAGFLPPTSPGRVGTYLSPHVVSVRERIWLDGRPISGELFAKYTFELWERLTQAAAAADKADPNPYGPHTKPFYFRFLTLLAFHIFSREGVRSAVVECGIGGEYDPTNVLPPSLVTAAVVTRLGIDHVAMLGQTLDAIAWHKAGIFKPGVAALTLPWKPNGTVSETDDEQAAALAVLKARAQENGALGLYEIPWDAVDKWEGIPDAALPGPFQKYNMALALAATRQHLRVLSGALEEIPLDLNPLNMSPIFRDALAKATLRGRCETVQEGRIEWLIDGAHTADSLAEVARYFALRGRNKIDARRILLFAVRDRSAADLVRAVVAGTPLANFFQDALFVFPPDAAAPRDAAIEAMAVVSPETSSTGFDSVSAAIQFVKSLAGTSIRVLATGSFVVAREVLQELCVDSEE